jgi:hypothetical protein
MPHNPEKIVKMAPFLLFYAGKGGAKGLQDAVDDAADKMSPEEGEKFRASFEKLKLHQQLKTATSLTTSVAVGRAFGRVPLPAAKALGTAWKLTGLLAVNNKIGRTWDKLKTLEQAHPRAYALLKEHIDTKLKTK